MMRKKKKMTERNRFYFYFDWLMPIKLMEEHMAFKVLMACLEYAESGKETSFEEPSLEYVYRKIIDRINSDSDDYKKTCEKNAENGKKGGRPPKDKLPIGDEAILKMAAEGKIKL